MIKDLKSVTVSPNCSDVEEVFTHLGIQLIVQLLLQEHILNNIREVIVSAGR